VAAARRAGLGFVDLDVVPASGAQSLTPSGALEYGGLAAAALSDWLNCGSDCASSPPAALAHLGHMRCCVGNVCITVMSADRPISTGLRSISP